MLDDPSETVAMGSDQNPLALLDLGDDLFVPEGQSASDGVLEALAGGELVLRHITIATILQHNHHYVCYVFLHLHFYVRTCVCVCVCV